VVERGELGRGGGAVQSGARIAARDRKTRSTKSEIRNKFKWLKSQNSKTIKSTAPVFVNCLFLFRISIFGFIESRF